jgi:hypothetical protein
LKALIVKRPNTPRLIRWAQDWAQLDRRTMAGIERALRDAGLLSTGCDRTEDAAWLLLTLCTGLPASVAVQEALRIAELVNVEQKANGQPFRGGDHGINLLGGLREVLVQSTTHQVQVNTYLADVLMAVGTPGFMLRDIQLSELTLGSPAFDGLLGRDFISHGQLYVNGVARTFTLTF